MKIKSLILSLLLSGNVIAGQSDSSIEIAGKQTTVQQPAAAPSPAKNGELGKALFLQQLSTPIAPLLPPKVPFKLYQISSLIHQAQSTGKVVRAAVEFTIKGVGRQQKQAVWFVNSKQDYRADDSLSVAIPDIIFDRLKARYGFGSIIELAGLTINVGGYTTRVKMKTYDDKSKTYGSYYQTHLYVLNDSDIQLLQLNPAKTKPVGSNPMG